MTNCHMRAEKLFLRGFNFACSHGMGRQPNSHFERVRTSGILFKRLHGVIFQLQEFPPAKALFTREPIASLKTPPKA
jgi:hypothetical protein